MLNLKRKLKIYLSLSVAVTTLFAAIVFASSQEQIDIDQFISPDICGGCHTQIFEQWEN